MKPPIRFVPARLLLITGILAACGDSTAPPDDDPKLETVCADAAALLADIDPLDPDAPAAVLGELLPGGWGGGTVSYFYMLEPDEAPRLREFVEALRNCAPGEALPLARARGAEVRPGNYDFTSLYSWYRAYVLQADWSQIEFGVIDDANNRLHFRAKSAGGVQPILVKALQLGIPEPAVFVDYVAPQG